MDLPVIRRCKCLTVLLLCLVITGCGANRTVKVDGLVTNDGNPVSNAAVIFIPVGTGRQGNGISDASGKFVLGSYGTNDGIPPGEYKVTVVKDPNFQADFKPL